MAAAFVPLPLPAYNFSHLFKAYFYEISITTSIITVLISIIVWNYYRSRTENVTFSRKELLSYNADLDGWLNKGGFNSEMLKGIRRTADTNSSSKNVEKDEQTKNSDAFLDYENLGPVYSATNITVENFDTNEKNISDAKQLISDSEEEDDGHLAPRWGKPKRQSISEALVVDNDVIGSLKTLHGKLATADLNLKARKLEQTMTEEERKEEEMVRKKQLESIFSLMAADKERFGLRDESDLLNQMRLYSFGK